MAPDSNRSAMARWITTRSPLWVEEVRFDDGTSGYATDGTPVDCVRFADLGLIGERPELILSGINHGANLGDDVTYSGTVTAALEGIVLGIPAIAVSQQSLKGEMGWHFGGKLDFTVASRFVAGLVSRIADHPLPEGTLINVNCPNEVQGVEVTTLGKRLYDDELRLVEEGDDGRKRSGSTGSSPRLRTSPGTDLAAQARGRISITPLHFDLTYHDGLDPVREWDLEDILGSDEDMKAKKRGERSCARRSPGTITPTTCSTTRRSATTSTTPC